MEDPHAPKKSVNVKGDQVAGWDGEVVLQTQQVLKNHFDTLPGCSMPAPKGSTLTSFTADKILVSPRGHAITFPLGGAKVHC